LTLYLDEVQKVLNDAGGIKDPRAKELFFCFINGVLFSHHGDALASREKAKRPLMPEYRHGILCANIE